MRPIKYLLLFAILLISLTSWSAEARRDGNWWIQQDKSTKYIYVIGFFDGMDLGGKFASWKMMDGPKPQKKYFDKATISFNEYSQKYLKNTTNDQIANGLDLFYSDFKNRKIKLSPAIWLVLNSISGTPKEELNKMTESWRRNANN